jgi:hypothetical protein
MMKLVTRLLVGSLITTLSGCAVGVSAAARPADVNGNWMGGTVTAARRVTMQLRQSGTNVTGTIAGTGVADGPVHGTLNGNTLHLSQQSGGAALSPLTVRGDVIEGGQLDGIPLKLVRTGSATR